MKPYSILIHGTGTCGEGNEASADIALQKLLEQLRTAGHNFTSVSMVIEGSTVPIIGAMQAHPAANAPASPDAVSLASISRQLAELVNLLSMDAKEPGEKTGCDEHSETEPAVTLLTLRNQLALLSTGQDGLFGAIADLAKKMAAAKAPKAGKQMAPVPGFAKKEEGAGLPGTGSTRASEGGNQVQQNQTTGEGMQAGSGTMTTQSTEEATGDETQTEEPTEQPAA